MQSRLNVIIILGLLAAVVGLIFYFNSPGGAPHEAMAAQNLPQPHKTIQISQAELDNAGKPDPQKDNPFQFVKPLPVGTAAPDFSVKTANGDTVKLSSFKGKKNVVLVFYQGSFCSICGMQLANLQSHVQDFSDQDAQIIAISADDMEHAQKTLGEHGLSFEVAPDPAKSIIDTYGVRNTAKNIAWPTAFIVDKKGIIQLSYGQSDMKRIHADELLPALSKLTGKPAPTLTYYE